MNELTLFHLDLGDRTPELPPFFRVRGRGLDGRAYEADGERADAHASAIEHSLHVGERPSLVADPVGGGDAALLEHELRGVRGEQAHLLLAFPRPEAGRAGANAERGERALVAAHDDDREAGERAVRDELLRARQDVAAVLAARAASRADRVRARARLG